MGLVEIFRAKVIDLSDHTLTIEVKSTACLILQITYIITGMPFIKAKYALCFFHAKGNWRSWKNCYCTEEPEQIWDQRSCQNWQGYTSLEKIRSLSCYCPGPDLMGLINVIDSFAA